jgi:hypothetical protein
MNGLEEGNVVLLRDSLLSISICYSKIGYSVHAVYSPES